MFPPIRGLPIYGRLSNADKSAGYIMFFWLQQEEDEIEAPHNKMRGIPGC